MGLFKDENGKWSLTRTVTILFVLAYFYVLAHIQTVPEFVITSITSIILVGIGGISARTALLNIKKEK